MNRFLLVTLVSFYTVGLVSAQQPLVIAPTVGVSSTGAGKFYYGKMNEPARAVEFKDRQVTTSVFLANINKYFDIPAEFSFIEKESNTDELGMQHRYLQQYYKGVPLEGMGYRVHEKGGFVTSANGRAVRNIKIDHTFDHQRRTGVSICAKSCTFKGHYQKAGYEVDCFQRFFVFAGSFSLAYQFDVDVSLIEQWRISIDARNGGILNKVSLVNTCGAETPMPLPYTTATVPTSYYGNQTIRVESMGGQSSRLSGQTENGGKIATYDFRNVSILSLTLFFEWHKVYDFYSSDNTYANPYQRTAVSVQWAAEQAYEYYLRNTTGTASTIAGVSSNHMFMSMKI
jgi:Zn-dependent metalloprotease